MNETWAVTRGAEKAELLLAAARYLNETLELERVYDRFRELLAEAVPHNGVIVSSFDPETELISCDYAWVDGEQARPRDPAAAAAEPRGRRMQSRVIMSGEPLLQNDVPEQVKDPGGVYYDVDREGHMRKLPDDGPPGVQSALMLPVKHEGEVVGVVQLMHETEPLRRRAARARRGPRRPDGRGRAQRAAARAGAGRGRGAGAGRGDGGRARAGGARARGGRRRRDDGRPRTARCASGTARPSSSPAARATTWSAARRDEVLRGLAGGRRRDPDLRGGRARRAR